MMARMRSPLLGCSVVLGAMLVLWGESAPVGVARPLREPYGAARAAATPETASASVSVSGPATEDEAETVHVTGSTTTSRLLFAYVTTSGEACKATAQKEAFADSTFLGEAATVNGSFDKTYTYTPTTIATYTICAYVAEWEGGTPEATGTASFSTAPPAASVAVSVSSPTAENTQETVTITGSTEVSRQLFAYASRSGEACKATAQQQAFADSSFLGEAATVSGSFTKTYAFTPTATATYTVCAYVAEWEGGTPNAAGSARFTNTSPVERANAEAAARERSEAAAAETRAQEEAAAANAKRVVACKTEYESTWRSGEEFTQEYGLASSEDTHCSAAEAKQFKAEIQARERAEGEAYERRYAAAKTASRHKALKKLSVSTVAHNGKSSAKPGYTALIIKAAPFATVTVKLTRYGHSTERYEFGENTREEIRRVWTCARPGGVYHYTVTARSGVGRTLTRRGEFKPVTSSRCDELKREEAEALERARAQEEAERAGEVQEELDRIRRYEDNCREENGTPREFETEAGNVIKCVAPGGGFLNVPE